VRVVRHWHRLPSEVVGATFLAALKARLDGAVSNVVYREVSLPMAGGWNEVILKALPIQIQTILRFYKKNENEK